MIHVARNPRQHRFQLRRTWKHHDTGASTRFRARSTCPLLLLLLLLLAISSLEPPAGGRPSNKTFLCSRGIACK